MKKILVALGIVSAVVSSHAQGYVLFQNAGNTRISTNSVVGGAATGRIAANDGTLNNSYYFALFSSTAQNTTVGGSAAAFAGVGTYAFNAAGWSVDPLALGLNGATAGQFGSLNPDTANSSQTQIPSGAAQTFVIIGWSGSAGTNVTQMEQWYNGGGNVSNPSVAGFIGESAVSGVLTPSSGGVSLPQATMGTTGGTIPGFNLGLIVPSPEPATMALAGLGGLALLGLRRKK